MIKVEEKKERKKEIPRNFKDYHIDFVLQLGINIEDKSFVIGISTPPKNDDDMRAIVNKIHISQLQSIMSSALNELAKKRDKDGYMRTNKQVKEDLGVEEN